MIGVLNVMLHNFILFWLKSLLWYNITGQLTKYCYYRELVNATVHKIISLHLLLTVWTNNSKSIMNEIINTSCYVFTANIMRIVIAMHTKRSQFYAPTRNWKFVDESYTLQLRSITFHINKKQIAYTVDNDYYYCSMMWQTLMVVQWKHASEISVTYWWHSLWLTVQWLGTNQSC